MILPRINLLRIKIHRCQTHVQVLRQWQPDSATAVLGAVEPAARHPTFGQALLDQGAEVLVVGIAWAVVPVQTLFEGFAGGAGSLVRGGGMEMGEGWRATSLEFLGGIRGSGLRVFGGSGRLLGLFHWGFRRGRVWLGTWLCLMRKRRGGERAFRSLGSHDWNKQIHCGASHLLMLVGVQEVAAIRCRLPFSLGQHSDCRCRGVIHAHIVENASAPCNVSQKVVEMMWWVSHAACGGMVQATAAKLIKACVPMNTCSWRAITQPGDNSYICFLLTLVFKRETARLHIRI